MSSSAILALIREKEEILKKLNTVYTGVKKLFDGLDCASKKFSEAGALMEESGSIGGKPFDGGKTSLTGHDFSLLASSTEGITMDIAGKISELEQEIARLQIEYQQALLREEQERMLAYNKAQARARASQRRASQK